MKIMTKKTLREIMNNKFRSLSIVLIVAITLGMLVGLRAAEPGLFATYKLNMREQNVADGTFSFTQMIDESNVTAISNNQTFLQHSDISEIEGRIFYSTELIFNDEPFKAYVIGIDFPTVLNRLIIEEKADDISDINSILDKNYSCLIETRFAGHKIKFLGQDVPLNANLSVNFMGNEVNLTVKGIAQDSYYTYLVDEISKIPLLGNLAVIWVNIDTVRNLLNVSDTAINQILFTVNERFNKDMIYKAAGHLTNFFSTNNIETSTIKFTIYDETDEYNMFLGDAGAADKAGTFFATLGLIICVVIISNTVSKLIYSQRKNIGLFLAMGSKKKEIVFHYLGIVMVLSIVGIILGIPLALYLIISMVKATTKIYGFHSVARTIPLDEFIIGTTVTFVICALSSVLSALPITRTTPREAMSVAFSRITITGKTLIEKSLSWIPVLNSIFLRIPLREVFLKKRKSMITILALTTSMIFLIISASMTYNTISSMEKNFDVYNNFDVKVTLSVPVPTQKISTFFKQNSDKLENITYHEIFLSFYTKIIRNDELLTWSQFECYQTNSTLRNYHVVKGDVTEKEDLGNSTIFLGKSLAGKYDIKIGDKINIGILGNYTVEVVGLVGELVDYSVLWTIESFQESGANAYFGIPNNYVNGITFNVKPGTDLKILRKIFEENFYIDTWTDQQTAKNSSLALLESSLGILMVFLGIGLAIGIIFSFQTMYMSFIDRHLDFIAFKAMGTKLKLIRRIIFIENGILSLFSLVLSVPIGYITYRWSIDYMMGNTFYVPYTIPLFIWPIILFLSLSSIYLATLRLMRKIKKMKLADELRQTGVS
ncbi:MAG: ABC transporter permease [Candidatus Heimdallarchaeaceae archaeon]